MQCSRYLPVVRLFQMLISSSTLVACPQFLQRPPSTMNFDDEDFFPLPDLPSHQNCLIEQQASPLPQDDPPQPEEAHRGQQSDEPQLPQKGPRWSKDAMNRLYALHEELGNKWTELATHFHPASDNDVKNLFYSTLRSTLRHINRTGAGTLGGRFRPVKIHVMNKIMAVSQQSLSAKAKHLPSLIDFARDIKKRMWFLATSHDADPQITANLCNELHEFARRFRLRKEEVHDEQPRNFKGKGRHSFVLEKKMCQQVLQKEKARQELKVEGEERRTRSTMETLHVPSINLDSPFPSQGTITPRSPSDMTHFEMKDPHIHQMFVQSYQPPSIKILQEERQEESERSEELWPVKNEEVE